MIWVLYFSVCTGMFQTQQCSPSHYVPTTPFANEQACWDEAENIKQHRSVNVPLTADQRVATTFCMERPVAGPF